MIMKRYFFLLVLTNFLLQLSAQEPKVEFSIRYQTYHRITEDQKVPDPSNRQLDIMTDGSSAFYPYYGMVKTIIGKDTVMTDERKAQSDYEPYHVLKNRPRQGKLTYAATVFVNKFYYEEPMPEMQWETLEGDTVICGYPCQKAQTTFRGRTWTAWYAMDLPYGDGPWKLCGQPGVILKAQDALGDFSFSAFMIGKDMVQKEDARPFVIKGYKKLTPKAFEEEQCEFYKDRFAYVSERNNFSKPDMKYTPKPQKPCLMEYFGK